MKRIALKLRTTYSWGLGDYFSGGGSNSGCYSGTADGSERGFCREASDVESVGESVASEVRSSAGCDADGNRSGDAADDGGGAGDRASDSSDDRDCFETSAPPFGVPVEVLFVDGVGGVDIAVIDPTGHRVDGEKPAERGDILPRAHFDSGDGSEVFVEFLVLACPAVVCVGVHGVRAAVVGLLCSDITGYRVDGLPERVIPSNRALQNPVLVCTQKDIAVQVRIQPGLGPVCFDHHKNISGQLDSFCGGGVSSVEDKIWRVSSTREREPLNTRRVTGRGGGSLHDPTGRVSEVGDTGGVGQGCGGVAIFCIVGEGLSRKRCDVAALIVRDLPRTETV